MNISPAKFHPALLLDRLQRTHGRLTLHGVEFDFSHPDVGDDWQPTTSVGFHTSGPFGSRTHGPRLGFPWTRFTSNPEIARRESLTRDALMLHILEHGDDGWFGPGNPIFDERMDLSGRPLLRHLITHGPDAWLSEGDKLVIRSATQMRVGDDLTADPDATALAVRYSIHRKDGGVERVRGKTLYAHRDNPTPWAISDGSIRVNAGLSVELAERRLRAVLGPGALDEDDFPTELCEVNAAHGVHSLFGAKRALNSRKRLSSYDERHLIELGFYLAKAEAAVKLRAQAERGLKTVRGGALGGRIRAENLRRWREENWEPEALRHALRVRQQVPSRNQKDLASDIQALWTLGGGQPGFDWLLAFIRAAERDKKIPPRKTNAHRCGGGR